MTFKSLQWNIGGAHVRRPDADPLDADSYRNLDLSYIASVLAEEGADIITLQETHATEAEAQSQVLAGKLGYAAINDTYDQSHIDPTQRLGQAVISRWPLSRHSYALFPNPGYSLTRPDGSIWRSHDKGMTSVSVATSDDAAIRVQTLHAIPFRPFAVDLESGSARTVLKSMESHIDLAPPSLLLQGDFNIDNETLAQYFPTAFNNGVQERPLAAGTTPKDRKYDHVLYRGLRLIDQKVRSDVLTDHYPVITTFEIS